MILPVAGDVVAMFDTMVRPPKTKRLLCVAAGAGWFLRINTRPIWRPCHPIAVRDNPGCLDHDSFVELRGLIDWNLTELAERLARREAAILGPEPLHSAFHLRLGCRQGGG